jgi:hypothetical protein
MSKLRSIAELRAFYGKIFEFTHQSRIKTGMLAIFSPFTARFLKLPFLWMSGKNPQKCMCHKRRAKDVFKVIGGSLSQLYF